MTHPLTHFNQEGQAHTVDVADKNKIRLIARASGRIQMNAGTLELIPLCHPLYLTHVEVGFKLDSENNAVECIVTTETFGRTGVEMEALTAVSTALLTIYDMCKAVDRGMTLTAIRLLEKQGGRSGNWQATA